ncbi:IS5 family transposase [Gemmata sp. G18]|uniref:IS5 family transposase n=1 Tax=Gemmata palustris TaxID=2822762 RepID=A0ABS5BVS8_9BACT|nr:IS5 family transposase [Gemmata palustris]
MKRAKSVDQWRISDELWEKLQPLLPDHPNTHRFGGGRPRKPDRVCADAIFFRLRTGCQWKALDATGMCPGSTAHARFQEWVAAGVFLKLWTAGLLEYDQLKGIDWSWLSMDGCMTKAPLGGKKDGPNPTDRGKSGVKRSLLVEGAGVPIGVAVDGANRNDFKMARATIERIAIKRPKPTKKKTQGMCLDKGYDYDEVRELLEEFGFSAHIRARGEEARELKRRAGEKARRWVVERAHSWLNRFRAVLIRWCKKSDNFLATLHFALAVITYRATGLTG